MVAAPVTRRRLIREIRQVIVLPSRFALAPQERSASLDLLRGLAALAVALPHYLMQQGDYAAAETLSVLAVEIFFVLSGFVLTPQILLCLERADFATLRTFLLRRWLRTIPTYLLALLAVSGLLGVVATRDFALYLVYAQNLWAQLTVRDYFPVAWSLSVEEWFYVVFPLAALLSGRLCKLAPRATAALTALALIVAASLLRSVWSGDMSDWGDGIRRVVVFRLDAIAFGVLLYLGLEKIGAKLLAAIAACALSAFVAVAALSAIDTAGSLWAKQLFPFVAAALGASAIGIACALDGTVRSAPLLRAMGIYLGSVSYPLYLFHLPVLLVLSVRLADLSVILQLAIYLVVILVVATAVQIYFERPILATRPRYAPQEADDGALGAAKL